jgi:hypothetical protein
MFDTLELGPAAFSDADDAAVVAAIEDWARVGQMRKQEPFCVGCRPDADHAAQPVPLGAVIFQRRIFSTLNHVWEIPEHPHPAFRAGPVLDTSQVNVRLCHGVPLSFSSSISIMPRYRPAMTPTR